MDVFNRTCTGIRVNNLSQDTAPMISRTRAESEVRKPGYGGLSPTINLSMTPQVSVSPTGHSKKKAIPPLPEAQKCIVNGNHSGLN